MGIFKGILIVGAIFIAMLILRIERKQREQHRADEEYMRRWHMVYGDKSAAQVEQEQEDAIRKAAESDRKAQL